jgi:hypothetical protein
LFLEYFLLNERKTFIKEKQNKTIAYELYD